MQNSVVVYGKNLCQHGMADMMQIGEMIKLMDLNSKDKILDLGCGNGLITEYLGNYLGAKITGVDISEATIARANIRVKNNPNVRFEVGDISNLNYPPASFTKIIAIDSIILWMTSGAFYFATKDINPERKDRYLFR